MRTLSILIIACVNGACVTADTGPLSLDVESSNRVAGSYLHHDVVIEFDISRGAGGHRTRFWHDDGSPIVDVHVDGSRQRMTLLDGELIVEGELGSPDPEIHGNIFAMRRLDARREVYAIERVYEHLERAGVDATLFTPAAPPPSAPRVLANGESLYWWSTFGPGPRTFEVVNATPTCVAIAVGSFPNGREVVLASGTQALTRYGWSGLILVENIGEWTAWSEPVCGASPVQVRVVL